MDNDKVLKLLHKTEYKGIVLGLERMRKLMGILGNPQDELSFIHVTGTNGKGSVSAFIESILICAGYRVGKYTSPAVEDTKEQYCVDGKKISNEEYLICAEIVTEASRKMEKNGDEAPTVFEIETALAFVYFLRQGCRYVVLETGLGGLLDATNIVSTTLLSVFTSISLDHVGMIGNNIQEITENKSGIIKPGCSVVMIENKDITVEKIIREKADGVNADLRVVRSGDIKIVDKKLSYLEYTNIDIPLKGSFQYDNCALAISACEELNNIGITISKEDIINGISAARWPFRMECICDKPIIVLDGAHNPDAALRLEKTIMSDYYDKDKKIVFILGIFKDKNYDAIVSHLLPHAKGVVLLELPNKKRTLDIDSLKQCVEKYADSSLPVFLASSIMDGCKKAVEITGKDDMIIACGSLSYLSEAKKSFMSII